MDYDPKVDNEISSGGAWLGSARRWMQNNVKDGDRLGWSSNETVHIPFCKLEELAKAVAIATIIAERKKNGKPE